MLRARAPLLGASVTLARRRFWCVAAALAWLALVGFGIAMTGCGDTSKSGSSSPRFFLTVKNVAPLDIPVDVFLSYAPPGAHPSRALTWQHWGLVTVPANGTSSYVIRGLPDRIAVVCPGGWPSHTRTRLADYQRSLTVEVP